MRAGSGVRGFGGARVLVLGFVGSLVLGWFPGPGVPGSALAQTTDTPAPPPVAAPGTQTPSPVGVPDTPAPVPSPAAASSTRYLVIPFEDASHDPRSYWLTEASAVMLTDDLLALGRSAITRADRLRAFEKLRIPQVPTLSHATAIRLGQIVKATHVVFGSFMLRDDVLSVQARIIRLDTGRMSADLSEVGSLADVFAVFGHVAQRIAPDSPVSTEQMEQAHPPIAGFEQYIKGLIAQAPATRESFLTQALKLAPTFHRVRIALWEVYTEQSNPARALAAVNPVPASSRQYRQARFLASLSQMSLGQWQAAYDTLTELNTAMPDSALFNNLGVIQVRRAAATGTRAVTLFDQAAQLDSSDGDLFFNLGYAFWLTRDVPAAIYWLREAVRRNPADEQAHYILGVALQTSGSTAEGARENELARRLSSTIDEWATQPGGPVPRGLERVKTELDVPAALRVENVIVAAGQRDQQELAALHLEDARRFVRAERDADAISALHRVVYLTPYEHEAHLLLGEIYLRQGRADEAVDELKIAIWSEDTLPAHLKLAEALVARGDTEAARAELQTVLSREPANERARELLDQLP